MNTYSYLKIAVRRRWVSWVCMLVSLSSPVLGLTWERSSVELKLEAGTGDSVALFPFKNEGAQVVTISNLKSSCGCSSPAVEERVIPAGGKGVLKVTYHVGDRVGLQSSRIDVSTDEIGVKPASLQLRVDIQPAVAFSVKWVKWRKSDGVVARTINIKRVGEKTVKILEAKPASDALSAVVRAGEEPDTWVLTLTPKTVETPSTTRVDLRVSVGERTMTQVVFGVVR